MDTEELERTKIGFRCRSCGITVFGWKRDLLCIACRINKGGRYREPTKEDRTNDN